MTTDFTLTRRALVAGTPAVAAVAMLPGLAVAQNAVPDVTAVRVHRVTQATPFPVNAYIVEGPDGLVVVDGLLTVTASGLLRQQVNALGKPLRAVLLTHPHPDHYAGIAAVTAGLDVPVVAVAGVNDVVRRDDTLKDEVIGTMFGDEWPSERAFPTQTATEGDVLEFGPSLRFAAMDIGPAESFHDSVFLLEGARPVAFAGDLAYGLMHSYMADNHNPDWRRAMDRLRADLPEDLPLLIGHGAPVTTGFLTWQETYLDVFEAAIRTANWSNPEAATNEVMTRMQDYLPSEELAFFAQLSVTPNAQRLGVL